MCGSPCARWPPSVATLRTRTFDGTQASLLPDNFKHASLAGYDVRTVNGAQVEYDQQGTGTPLLLIHSLLTELTVFDLMLPRLASERRVTRINLPGFGASSPVELSSVAAHADHLAGVMDALELPREAAVFGNGFGAFVALE